MITSTMAKDNFLFAYLCEHSYNNIIKKGKIMQDYFSYGNYNHDKQVKNLLAYMKDKKQGINENLILSSFDKISLYKDYRGKSLLSHLIQTADLDKLNVLVLNKKISITTGFIIYELNGFLKKIDKLSNGQKQKKRFLNLLEFFKLSSIYNTHSLLFTTLELQSRKPDAFYEDIISKLNQININMIEFNKGSLENRTELLSAYIHYSDYRFWHTCYKYGLKLETEFLLTHYMSVDYKNTVLLFKNANCDLSKNMEATYSYKREYDIETIQTNITFNLSGYLKNLTYKDKLDIDTIVSCEAYYSHPFIHYEAGKLVSDMERRYILSHMSNWKDTIISSPSFSLNENTLFHEYVNAFNFLHSHYTDPYYSEYNKIKRDLYEIMDKTTNLNLNIYLRNNRYLNYNSFLSHLLIENKTLLLEKGLQHDIDPNIYYDDIHSIFNKKVYQKLLVWDNNELIYLFNNLKKYGLHFSLSFEEYEHTQQLYFFDTHMQKLLIEVFPEHKKEIYTYHLLHKIQQSKNPIEAHQINLNILMETEKNSNNLIDILHNMETMIYKQVLNLSEEIKKGISHINNNMVIHLSKNILSEIIITSESKKVPRI